MIIKVLGKGSGKGRGFCGHIIKKDEVYFLAVQDNDLMTLCKNCMPSTTKASMTVTAQKLQHLGVRNGRVFFMYQSNGVANEKR